MHCTNIKIRNLGTGTNVAVSSLVRVRDLTRSPPRSGPLLAHFGNCLLQTIMACYTFVPPRTPPARQAGWPRWDGKKFYLHSHLPESGRCGLVVNQFWNPNPLHQLALGLLPVCFLIMLMFKRARGGQGEPQALPRAPQNPWDRHLRSLE